MAIPRTDIRLRIDMVIGDRDIEFGNMEKTEIKGKERRNQDLEP